MYSIYIYIHPAEENCSFCVYNIHSAKENWLFCVYIHPADEGLEFCVYSIYIYTQLKKAWNFVCAIYIYIPS